jgi:thiamine biosynthesis protein ThiC
MTIHAEREFPPLVRDRITGTSPRRRADGALMSAHKKGNFCTSASTISQNFKKHDVSFSWATAARPARLPMPATGAVFRAQGAWRSDQKAGEHDVQVMTGHVPMDQIELQVKS